MRKIKSHLFVWILLSIFITILFLIYNFVSNTARKAQENIVSIEEYKRVAVTNASEFFTVANCISKYVTFLQAKEKESIYVLLDQEYIDKNDVSVENVLSFVPDVKEGSISKCIKMYKKRINEQVVSYYVHFQVEENVFEGIGEKSDLYAIVYLMENKGVFSIRNYNGEVFINES